MSFVLKALFRGGRWFKKFEDLRRSREQQDFATCTSFNRDMSLARLS